MQSKEHLQVRHPEDKITLRKKSISKLKIVTLMWLVLMPWALLRHSWNPAFLPALTYKDSVLGKVCPVPDMQRMLGNVGFHQDVVLIYYSFISCIDLKINWGEKSQHEEKLCNICSLLTWYTVPPPSSWTTSISVLSSRNHCYTTIS